jgi:hypothetical protein
VLAWIGWAWGYAEVGVLLPYLLGERYLTDMALDTALVHAEHALFGCQPALALRRHFIADGGTGGAYGVLVGGLDEIIHAVYLCFVPLLAGCMATCAATGRLRVRHNALVLHLTLVFICCWLIYLCAPVYGPIFSLGSGPANSLQAAEVEGVANGAAWRVGHRCASTGTAFPSSHVAVTAAILFEAVWSSTGRHRVRGCAAMVIGAGKVLVPLIWLATVWCGFHFVLDGIAGLVVAAVCRMAVRCHMASDLNATITYPD